VSSAFRLHSYFSPALQRRVIKTLTAKKTRQFLTWAAACASLLILWAWNWQLVLATAAGVGSMIGVYHLQGQNWRSLWQWWRTFVRADSGKLSLAVACGGFGSLATYLAVAIWTHTENRWLAFGSILQGFGTLLTLILLGWHFLDHRDQKESKNFDRWLEKLTANDPLTRLMAIRRLSEMELSPNRRQQCQEYFRYLLSRETDAQVRSALLDNFTSKEINQPQPLQMPLQVKKSVLKYD
jgi:hypothetical protein